MSPRGTRAQGHHDGDDVHEQPVELTVVARRAGLRISIVRRYLTLGLIEPASGSGQSPLFAPSSAARVAKADRLRRDLGLNSAGAVLALELLDRIRELEVRSARDPDR
jgi:DNA-binding transcriptional MerR regulator